MGAADPSARGRSRGMPSQMTPGAHHFNCRRSSKEKVGQEIGFGRVFVPVLRKVGDAGRSQHFVVDTELAREGPRLARKNDMRSVGDDRRLARAQSFTQSKSRKRLQ